MANKKVIFSSHSVGLIVNGISKGGLTDNQKLELKRLELIKTTPVGVTAAQQRKIDKYSELIKSGAELNSAQEIENKELNVRLTKFKELTEKQEITLSELVIKRDSPPQLSKGGKSAIKAIWLKNEKFFQKDINSKFLEKGIESENDCINLVSIIDGVHYRKNSERKTIGLLTGECDIKHYFKEQDLKMIDDVKSSFDPQTFMSADLKSIYEWQGVSYCHLYDADAFRLRYCLVNCPPSVFSDEYKKFCYSNKIVDGSLKEYRPLIIQFFLNYIYDFEAFKGRSKFYPPEFSKLIETEKLESKYEMAERVKTFSFARNTEQEQLLLTALKLANEYYQTITLNMID